MNGLYYSTAEDTGRVNQLSFAYHGGSHIHNWHFKRPATNLGDGEPERRGGVTSRAYRSSR